MSPGTRKKRSPLITCGLVVIAIGILCFCCTVLLGSSGYYLFSSGRITLNDILNLVNLGPGEIQLVNLSDGRVEVELRWVDDEDGDTYHQDSASLEPYDMAAFRSVSSGHYELIINVPNGRPRGDTCYLNVRGGSSYHVAVVPDGIVIVLEGDRVTEVEEVNMATTEMCER